MFENDFKKRQKGTGFTNINRILGANVGAGQQMAGKIAQGIQTAGQNVRGQIGQAQQQFNTNFKTGTEPALGAISTTSGIQKLPGESDEAYSARIKNPGIDYSKIGQEINQAKYTGPKGLENEKGLIGSAVNVGQLGGLTTSGLGQQQLLKQFAAGRQGYSKGQGALDQLLLGQNLSAQQQLQQASGSVSDIPENVRSAIESTQAQASGMTTGINKEKSKVLQGVQSSISDIENRGKAQAQQYSRDASRLVELLKDPSKEGLVVGDSGTQYSEEQAAIDKRLKGDLKRFGIDPNSQLRTYDPSKVKEIIQEIANKASLVQTPRYSDSQRAALQKLAQFQQDENKAGQIAAQKNKNAFALSDIDFKNLAKVQEQEDDITTKKTNYETSQKDINDIINTRDAQGVGDIDTVKEVIIDMAGVAGFYNSWLNNAAKYLGDQRVHDIVSQVEHQEGGVFGSSAAYKSGRVKNAIQDELRNLLNKNASEYSSFNEQASKTASLQDYLNSL
jgi:hypothetical protein